MEPNLYKLNTDKYRFDIITEQEFYNINDISYNYFLSSSTKVLQFTQEAILLLNLYI